MADDTTYDGQVEKLLSYLDRDGDDAFEAQIPNFFYDAQTVISRDSKFLGFLVSLTSTFTISNNGVVQKPARWRSTVSWNYGTGVGNATRNILYPRTYEYCRQYWPNPTTTSTPKYYADYVSNYWLVAPSPDAAYPFETMVYQTPEYLSSSNQTNWLTQYAPDLLFWQVCVQAGPWLKNDERIQLWMGLYEKARDSQRVEFENRLVDRTVLVTGAA